jgi:FKBP-type peptidyl-prolyl cis-trans isomerase SlyD
MKAGPNRTVFLDYQLYDEDGLVIDNSPEGEPLCFVFGEGSIIPGLERELEGMVPGESKEVVVKPEDAYGPRDPGLVQQVPKERFAGGPDLVVGTSYIGKTDDGQVINFLIIGMDDHSIEIDLNHPLAGMSLRFQVIIKEVREGDA